MFLTVNFSLNEAMYNKGKLVTFCRKVAKVADSTVADFRETDDLGKTFWRIIVGLKRFAENKGIDRDFLRSFCKFVSKNIRECNGQQVFMQGELVKMTIYLVVDNRALTGMTSYPGLITVANNGGVNTDIYIPRLIEAGPFSS